MKQVTRVQFYEYVNPRDICITSTSRGLSYSLFETRDRKEVGRVYWSSEYDDKGMTIRYFLTDECFELLTNNKTKQRG